MADPLSRRIVHLGDVGVNAASCKTLAAGAARGTPGMPCSVDSRAPIVETLQLGCACGAAILGVVLVGRAPVAHVLFEPHLSRTPRRLQHRCYISVVMAVLTTAAAPLLPAHHLVPRVGVEPTRRLRGSGF